jgi:hypothetical protein
MQVLRTSETVSFGQREILIKVNSKERISQNLGSKRSLVDVEKLNKDLIETFSESEHIASKKVID